ncbi:MAG: hypothetical protein V4596_14130 [Bdellovibrionota bacterium]
MSKSYLWQRYVCSREGSYHTDPDGFIIDPETKYGKDLQPNLNTIEKAEESKCTIYLGEPGIGKSQILLDTVSGKRPKADANTIIIHENLNNFGSEERLIREIFHSAEIEEWKNNGKNLYLYIDSLDECLLRVDTVSHILAREISKLPKERLFVRISCRTGVWPQYLEKELETIFPGSLSVYEMVPLLEKDIVVACENEGVDPASFIKEVKERGVVPLAIKPVTLKFLLNTFKSKQKLADDQKTIYSVGCLQLCEEQSKSRLVSPKTKGMEGTQKLAIAERIAILSILSNKNSIWLGPEHERDQNDLTIKDIAEDLDGLDRITAEELLQTLDSGLFTSRGINRMGWAHQTYAEFLMAQGLNNFKIETNKLNSLFFNPNPSNPKLVPQLQQGAAFLASMNRDFFNLILNKDPEVLLQCDLSGLPEEYKKQTVQKILEAEETGNSYLHIDLGFRERFKGLKYEGLDDKLAIIILDKKLSFNLRKLAVDIAEICELHTLMPVLLEQALDKSEDYQLRVNSASTISILGDTKTKAELKKLLEEEDPNDQLKGYALQSLWPEQITAEELFKYIIPPKNDFYHGSYAHFISYDLIEEMPDDALPIALAWVEEHADKHTNHSKMGRAIEKIIYHCWNKLDAIDLYPNFAKVAYKRLDKHLPIASRFESKEYAQEFYEAVEKRRKIFLSIIQIPLDDFKAVHAQRLLDNRDFFWLLELANKELDPSKFEKIIETLRFVFDWANTDHTDALFPLYQNNSSVNEKFKSLYGPIILQSEDEKRMRKLHEQGIELKNLSKKKDKVDWANKISGFINETIEEIEEGKIEHFYHLARLLTANQETGEYALRDEHIEDSPSWLSLDNRKQEKIISYAKKFLEEVEPNIESYLKKNSIEFVVSAGIKAISLINKYSPEFLSQKGKGIWPKWLSPIVAYPTFGADEVESQKNALKIGYPYAQDVFEETILKVADKEGREGNGNIFVISRFSSYINRDLQEKLHILARSLPPLSAIALLGEILSLGYSEAEHLLASYISSPLPKDREQRDIVLAAARNLVAESSKSGWNILWPILEKDKEFGQELILDIVAKNAHETAFVEKLSDEQLVDFYSWMIDLFPYSARMGGAIGPKERAGDIRDACFRILVNRGTRSSCDALKKMVQRHKELPWLNYHLTEAEKRNRSLEWVSPEPSHLLLTITNKSKRLVRNQEELMQVILESILRYQESLQGTPPSTPDIWNTERDKCRPKDENEISDHLKRHFDRDIKSKGIIANREVQIRPSVGPGTGQRTDIQIDATIKGKDGIDILTVIVEVKGCWNDGVYEALQTQLVDRYLKQNSTRHGIYVVADCLCERWTDEDLRKNKSKRNEVRANFSKIENLATEQEQVAIETILLDCTFRS